MKKTQLNRGLKKRIMYVESKGAPIDQVHAHIGWVTFSKSGHTVYYRDKVLSKVSGISGNFRDEITGDEYWVSGIKKKGSNAHYAMPVQVVIDEDAKQEYQKIRQGGCV